MPVSTVPGHAGLLRLGTIGDVPVACLQGRSHLYEGHDLGTVTIGVRLLARLGCRAILLTNAAGGISQKLSPGDRMLIVDHLNLTGRNPLVGPVDPPLARFPDMSEAYDRRLCALAHAAARAAGTPLHEGVYAGVLGPSYETPAEVRMLRALGADAVGMSTVIEVIALRQLGIRVAAVSCITNMAAGISSTPLEHREVEQIAARASGPFVDLLTRWVSAIGAEVGR
jgi:purine-nucleoside phosphorylase